MAVGFEEKRLVPRIKFKSPVHCKIRGTCESIDSESSDISLRGVSFLNRNFIAPNTYLSLEFNIFSRMFNVNGKITSAVPLPHEDKFRLGIEFVEVEDKLKNEIGDFIDLQLENHSDFKQ